MKRIAVVFALFSITLSQGFSQNIGVSINGEPIQFTSAGPQSVNGRVLVPLRGVMEKLGAYVGWDASTQTVTATRGDIDIELRIGERVAKVNGRAVSLDVPAQVYRGTTLVPLRFMGEALGAQVRWNESTRTVNISTSDVTVPPSPNPNPPPTRDRGVEITSFEARADGWLKAGSTIDFVLTGTAGGTATFQIPGVSEPIPMLETSQGRYVGTWAPPASGSSPITASRAVAIGKLKVGSSERLIQAATPLQIDTQPPKLGATTPDANGKVTRNRPNISAVFDEASGSGVNPDMIRMEVDGRDVTREATVTGNFIAYRPTQPLETGPHQVFVSVQDRAGNSATKSWAFTVASETDVVKTFSHTGSGNLDPGQVITFTLLGAKGGNATFSIGNKVLDVPMREVEDGKYVGEYVVRKGDSFVGEPVIAKLRTASGETYTIDAPQGIGVRAGKPEPPKITSPLPKAAVQSPLVIKGTALPRSKVQLRVDYRTNVFGGLGLGGSIAELEIDVDDHGNFVSQPIDLETLVASKDTTYTITAVTVGANGQKSEETVVPVKR